MHKFKVKLNKEKQNEKLYYTIIHINSRPTLRDYTFFISNSIFRGSAWDRAKNLSNFSK